MHLRNQPPLSIENQYSDATKRFGRMLCDVIEYSDFCEKLWNNFWFELVTQIIYTPNLIFLFAFLLFIV